MKIYNKKGLLSGIICTLLGVWSIFLDFIEENDERNKLIVYKSKSRMLDIVYGILFIVMICGMVGFKMTANMIWFSIFIIPGFLLGLFVLIEIFVKLYYEKHE